MKKLILPAFILAPVLANAALPNTREEEGSRQIFINIQEVMALPVHQAECVRDRAEKCPEVLFKDGTMVNPENTEAARACQIQVLESCKKI